MSRILGVVKKNSRGGFLGFLAVKKNIDNFYRGDFKDFQRSQKIFLGGFSMLSDAVESFPASEAS